jgi:hypothetical protein
VWGKEREKELVLGRGKNILFLILSSMYLSSGVTRRSKKLLKRKEVNDKNFKL